MAWKPYSDTIRNEIDVERERRLAEDQAKKTRLYKEYASRLALMAIELHTLIRDFGEDAFCSGLSSSLRWRIERVFDVKDRAIEAVWMGNIQDVETDARLTIKSAQKRIDYIRNNWIPCPSHPDRLRHRKNMGCDVCLGRKYESMLRDNYLVPPAPDYGSGGQAQAGRFGGLRHK